MEYRINGFEQIKSFYSIVFEQKFEMRTQHISLYVFLINQNNRNNWVEWFKCPFDLAMAGSCIGNKKTYYKCLSDLQEWGLLEYEKGVNDYKAPKIKLEVLNRTTTDTATVPQSEPLLQPLLQPQGIPLGTHIYKLITDNIKQLTQEDLILINDFVTKHLNRKAKFDFFKSLLDLGVDEKIAEDWMLVRKNKKAANTETAFKAIAKEITLSGLTANECIEIAVVRSWQGFNADWLNANNKSTQATIDFFELQEQKKNTGRILE